MHGREPLKITVMDKDTFGNDDLEGMCLVSLNEYKDQLKHDDWFNLTDEQGRQSQGRIRIMMHWVYSKVQYFSEYLSRWDNTLDNDIAEKQEIEKFLKLLETPFGFLEAMQQEIDDEIETGNDDPQS